MSATPLTYRYEGDGEFKACGPAMQRRADDHFVVGMRYRLTDFEESTGRSRAHYFALLDQAWQSMPANLIEEYPSREVMRHKLLIQCGYANHADFVFSTNKDAAQFIRFAKRNPYSVVTINDSVVRVFEAHSQSAKAMGKETFQASKDAVLNAVSELLGTSVEDLRGAA
jgi:hypothetical protein